MKYIIIDNELSRKVVTHCIVKGSSQQSEFLLKLKSHSSRKANALISFFSWKIFTYPEVELRLQCTIVT